MRWIRRLFKEEDGAVVVIVALALVVLLGCMAMVVDAGVLYVNKAHLQNVADAAALAGAQELPDKGNAKEEAYEYGVLNGIVIDKNDITFDGEDKIKVECKTNVPYFFARIWEDFDEAAVSASAKAKKISQWDGEVLPFLNTNNDLLTYGTQLEAWEKVSSGYFECIGDYTIENNESPYDKLYFRVNLDKGLKLDNGTIANKKDEIGYYYNTHKSSLTPTPYVYIFSLSPKAIEKGKVTMMDGTEVDIPKLNKYINKNTYFPLDNFVLLKCTFDSYDKKKKTLYLTSVQAYDLGNNDPDNPFPDYPPDYVNPEGGGAILIE